MARINTNVSSLIARTNLARSNADLDTRLERLSTGLRINRGKDDPAGIIISQRITTDLGGINAAISNADRAGSVIATTEGSLNEVSNLLNDIKGLLVQSANLGGNSKEERDANQIQIDSAIQSITRIANSASFGGLNLLDGSLDYVTSGVANSAISTSQIFSASFVGTPNIAVDVEVIASAQQASLFMNGNTGISTDGHANSAFTMAIRGPEGQLEIGVTSSQTFTEIVAAINSNSSSTGVEATLIDPANSAMGLVFQSVGFGSNKVISVERINGPSSGDNFEVYQLNNDIDIPTLDGTFDWAGLTGSFDLTASDGDEGRDVSAMVNGNLAAGDGFNISINTPTLAMEMLLDQAFATDPNAAITSFNITGGGSLFQIGPDITAQQQASIGIQSVVASELGGTLTNGTVQFLTSLMDGKDNSIESSKRSNDFTAAQDILEAAIDDISVLRGRLGAFERNVLNTSQRSLQSQFENLTASKSRIMDADFAVETSELTRLQILQSAGTSVLALANQSSQNVLQLLG